jgi:hypothetical protein
MDTLERANKESEIQKSIQSSRELSKKNLDDAVRNCAELRAQLDGLLWERRKMVFAKNHVRSFIDYHSFTAHMGGSLCVIGVCMSLFVLLLDGEPMGCVRMRAGSSSERETFVARVSYRTIVRSYGRADSAIVVSEKDYLDAKDAVTCAHVCWTTCMVSFCSVLLASRFQRLLPGLVVASLASLVAVIVLAGVGARRRFFLYFMISIFVFYFSSAILYFSFSGVFNRMIGQSGHEQRVIGDMRYIASQNKKIGDLCTGGSFRVKFWPFSVKK